MKLKSEVLIVGSGITGLTIAREFLKRGLEDILIIEKEKTVGAHASGRNSGVLHFTRSVEDKVYAGPTAIPVFGREDYRFFKNFSLETFSILFRDVVLLFKNEPFRCSAITEFKKYSMRFFFEEAKVLVPELCLDDLEDTDKVGIRPQLVHWPSKRLVTDFLLIKEEDSLHVLNAISPAFTSSMAFAKHAVDLFMT